VFFFVTEAVAERNYLANYSCVIRVADTVCRDPCIQGYLCMSHEVMNHVLNVLSFRKWTVVNGFPVVEFAFKSTRISKILRPEA
jgi:hypothetical protein